MPTLYFAHPITAYATAEEDAALATLTTQGWTVVTPSDAVHQDACGADMTLWAALAGSCDAIAAMPFADGAWGAGVAKELDRVVGQGKPAWQVSPDGQTVTPLTDWPSGQSVLSVEATRERLRPFREARVAAGLPAIPVRATPAPVMLRRPRM